MSAMMIIYLWCAQTRQTTITTVSGSSVWKFFSLPSFYPQLRIQFNAAIPPHFRVQRHFILSWKYTFKECSPALSCHRIFRTLTKIVFLMIYLPCGYVLRDNLQTRSRLVAHYLTASMSASSFRHRDVRRFRAYVCNDLKLLLVPWLKWISKMD